MTDQGCAFGNCFARLFLVLQRSALSRMQRQRSISIEIGEKPAIN
jgi:hypothetical protein